MCFLFFFFDYLFIYFEFFKNYIKNIFFYDNFFNYDNINISVFNKNNFNSFVYFNNNIIFRLNHIVPFVGQNAIIYSFNDICENSNYKCKASFLEWLAWRRQFIVFWVRDFYADNNILISHKPFYIFKFWLIEYENFTLPKSGYPFNETYVRRVTILKTLLNPLAMSQFLFSLIEPTFINEYIYLEFLKSNLSFFFYEYGKYLFLPVNLKMYPSIIEKNIFYEYLDWSMFFFFYLKLLSFNIFLLDNLNIPTEIVLTDKKYYINYYNRSLEFLKSLPELNLYLSEDSRMVGFPFYIFGETDFIEKYKYSDLIYYSFQNKLTKKLTGLLTYIFCQFELKKPGEFTFFFFDWGLLLDQLKDLKNIVTSYGDSNNYVRFFIDRFVYNYYSLFWYERIAVLLSSPITYLYIYIYNFLGNCFYILDDNAYIVDTHLYRCGDWYYNLSFKNKYRDGIFTIFTNTQRWSIFQDYLDNNILSNLNRWYDCDGINHGKFRNKDRVSHFMKGSKFAFLPWSSYEESWREMSFRLEETIDHPKYKRKYFFWEFFQKNLGKIYNINDDYLDKQAEIARGIKSRELIVRRFSFQKRYHRKRLYLGLGTFNRFPRYRRPRNADLIFYTKNPLVKITF